MNLIKSFKIPIVAGAFLLSAWLLSGCGVSEAQYAQLDALQAEVNSLQDEANT